MPSIVSRLSSALFPTYTVHVSTMATLIEARALAVQLVSKGKQVSIQPAAQGFTVSEVC